METSILDKYNAGLIPSKTNATTAAIRQVNAQHSPLTKIKTGYDRELEQTPIDDYEEMYLLDKENPEETLKDKSYLKDAWTTFMNSRDQINLMSERAKLAKDINPVLDDIDYELNFLSDKQKLKNLENTIPTLDENSEEYKKYIKHITGMNTQISEREIWDHAGIDYDEDDPIDRKMYEQKYEKSVPKVEIPPPKIAELTDEQWDASPDFIKEWAEYEAESFIDRFRCLESEFKMNTSSTGYYSQFVSKWESSVYKELQLLEVTTNEAEQLLKRLQRAIKGTASRVRINQALQTNNLEAAIREKEEERESKRALLKARKNRNIYDNN